jgi:hypothetical protein
VGHETNLKMKDRKSIWAFLYQATRGAANWRIAAGGRWQSMIKPKARCDQLLSEIPKKEINCIK